MLDTQQSLYVVGACQCASRLQESGVHVVDVVDPVCKQRVLHIRRCQLVHLKMHTLKRSLAKSKLTSTLALAGANNAGARGNHVKVHWKSSKNSFTIARTSQKIAHRLEFEKMSTFSSSEWMARFVSVGVPADDAARYATIFVDNAMPSDLSLLVRSRALALCS